MGGEGQVLKFVRFMEKVSRGGEVGERRALRSSSRDRGSDSLPTAKERRVPLEQSKRSKGGKKVGK